jgi:GAF domain-containing protein
MAGMKQALRCLEAARSAVERAVTVREALRGIARALHDEFPGIMRASLRVIEPDGESMRVVAVWSGEPTSIEEGMIVRTSATSFPELLRRPRALIRSMNQLDRPLDDVLRREGIWAWVSIPVRERGETSAMLSLSSGDPDEFDAGDDAFFTELGAIVEGRLISLVESGEIEGRGQSGQDGD